MAHSETGRKSRGIRIAHTCSIAVALVCGSYALVALLIGSPLEFGIALALCGAGWVGANLVEKTVEHDARGREPVARPRSDHRLSHAVFVTRRPEGARVLNHPSARPQRYCLAPNPVYAGHGAERMTA